MSALKLSKFLRILSFGFLLLLLVFFSSLNHALAEAIDSKNILPERERARVMDEWLKWRLENIIPDLMRREGIDMWLIICAEANEDPAYFSLMPADTMYASRTSILIFHDRGKELGVERLTGSSSGIGEWYKPTWLDKKKLQFDSLAELIKKRNPKKIGINTSPISSYADGLSASLKDKLVKALGPEYSSRLVSAERVCVGWLETRSPQELSVYRHLCGITHDIIGDFYSNRVIIPDITTTSDVEWWIRQRLTDLGLSTWFQPGITIQRNKKEEAKYKDKNVIRRGDLLHCDFGIKYLGLCTDMQWSAYVLKPGEVDAPQVLKDALTRAARVAEIFMTEFQPGKKGNDVVTAAMKKADAEGLRPLIYCHSIGVHGHAAGARMDARPPDSAPENIIIRGEYPLFLNTAYSIEFSSTTTVPEWNNQDIRIGYEDDAALTERGCKFFDGNQTQLILIK